MEKVSLTQVEGNQDDNIKIRGSRSAHKIKSPYRHRHSHAPNKRNEREITQRINRRWGNRQERWTENKAIHTPIGNDTHMHWDRSLQQTKQKTHTWNLQIENCDPKATNKHRKTYNKQYGFHHHMQRLTWRQLTTKIESTIILITKAIINIKRKKSTHGTNIIEH